MKNNFLPFILSFLCLCLFSISCKDKEMTKEEREEAKVGKVYDTARQGIRHENIENQFPSSRNDNDKEIPLTKGISDTTVNMTDTIKEQPK